MAYILNLFSPETWSAFLNGSRTVSGFRESQYGIAQKRVHTGDMFVCYLTGLSRWCGVLEITSEAHKGSALYSEGDPYVIHFTVRPIVCLPPESAIPIHEKDVWSTLSFTRDMERSSSRWTGIFRNSLNVLTPLDGEFLRTRLEHQHQEQRKFPLSDRDIKRLAIGSIDVPIDIPITPVVLPKEDDGNTETGSAEDIAEFASTRESIVIQAKVAQIGATMGFSIWVPANDRVRVLGQVPESMHDKLLEELNLGYDPATLSTVRQIDVLWLRRNAIIRAFEVEHTTAIYSGLLRMADLLALQPNINIKLHIVADSERQAKVMREITRPVFSSLDLQVKCSFLSYAKVNEIASHPDLPYLTDGVISNHEIWAQG